VAIFSDYVTYLSLIPFVERCAERANVRRLSDSRARTRRERNLAEVERFLAAVLRDNPDVGSVRNLCEIAAKRKDCPENPNTPGRKYTSSTLRRIVGKVRRESEVLELLVPSK
jgi:hypothetical protein